MLVNTTFGTFLIGPRLCGEHPLQALAIYEIFGNN